MGRIDLIVRQVVLKTRFFVMNGSTMRESFVSSIPNDVLIKARSVILGDSQMFPEIIPCFC